MFDRFRLSSFRRVNEHGFSIYFWDYFEDYHQDNNFGEEWFFCLPLHPYHIPVSKCRYRIQSGWEYRESYVFYPQSKCHELDILVARFLLRKYKVTIIYDNKVKIKKNVYYKYFRLSFFLVIRDILFEFKEKKTPFKDKQSLDRNTF